MREKHLLKIMIGILRNASAVVITTIIAPVVTTLLSIVMALVVVIVMVAAIADARVLNAFLNRRLCAHILLNRHVTVSSLSHITVDSYSGDNSISNDRHFYDSS